MILEHVLITIDPDLATDYERAFTQAKPMVMAQRGSRSCRLLSAEDSPGEYLLLIEWDERSDHTDGFRKSEEYQEWAKLLHPFYRIFPTVRYFALEK